MQAFIIFLLLLAGCQTAQKAQEKCHYQLLTDQLTFQWEAYKTNEKIAVPGTFDSIAVEVAAQDSTIPALLKSAQMKIVPQSVNSKNPDRDRKIARFYFGVLQDSQQIRARVVEVKGDDSTGVATISLYFNGMEAPMTMDYKVSQNKLHLEGVVDVVQWKADTAVKRLNEACYDLHKGEDGESRLWSEVKIIIEVPVEKVCP